MPSTVRNLTRRMRELRHIASADDLGAARSDDTRLHAARRAIFDLEGCCAPRDGQPTESTELVRDLRQFADSIQIAPFSIHFEGSGELVDIPNGGGAQGVIVPDVEYEPLENKNKRNLHSNHYN